MIQIIEGVIGFVLLIFKNYFEHDKALKKQTEEKIKELQDAIKSGDASRVNDILSG